MANKRVGKFPKAFRQMAVDRLKQCDNIVALSKELGVHRRLLYRWRDQLEPSESAEGLPPVNSRETILHNAQLMRLQRSRQNGRSRNFSAVCSGMFCGYTAGFYHAAFSREGK